MDRMSAFNELTYAIGEPHLSQQANEETRKLEQIYVLCNECESLLSEAANLLDRSRMDPKVEGKQFPCRALAELGAAASGDCRICKMRKLHIIKDSLNPSYLYTAQFMRDVMRSSLRTPDFAVELSTIRTGASEPTRAVLRYNEFPCNGPGSQSLLKGEIFIGRCNFGKQHKVDYIQSLSTWNSCYCSLELVKFWLQTCRRSHGRCTWNQSQARHRPTRLIDVSKFSTGGVISIINTHVSTMNCYLALSHCWGQTKTVMLTSQNERALYKGIQFAELPEAYKDAILITERLGYNYLWIDSLCIFQDSPDD